MLRWLARRLVSMVPTLVGITVLTWAMVELAPGDPVAASFGADPSASEAERARLADVARAKRQLLGFLDADPGLVDLADPGHRVALEAWPRALAVVGERVAVGDARGAVQWVGGGEIGHLGAEITALAPRRDVLAAAAADGTVALWDGEEVRRPGAGTAVRALAWSRDGLLVASDDGRIALLDGDLRERRAWTGHAGVIYALAANGDGFWSGGADRVLRRWSLDAEVPVAEVRGHRQAIRALVPCPGGVATASDDGAVRLASADGLVVEVGEHDGRVTALLWADERLVSGSADETVRVWRDLGGGGAAEEVVRVGPVSDLVVDGRARILWVAAETWREVPAFRRYGRWVSRLAHLDLGRSFSTDRPVLEELGRALPVTLLLNGLALLVIYLVAVPVGVLAALKPRGWFDSLSSLGLFALYSVPHFWAATLLILVLASERYLDLLPSGGLTSTDPWDLSILQLGGDLGLHLLLPVAVLSYAGLAQLSRFVRTSMLETVEADFVRTARAKGLSEARVVWAHAFRNALVTPVTLLGQVLPALVGGSVVVEYIFGIHGMGLLGLEAVLSRDYPVIMAITVLTALLTLGGVLLSDLLYGLVDPRVEVEP